MPSIYQGAGRHTYKPTGLESEYGEDPARFLNCGKGLATARIRGIQRIDLLRAYAQIEAEGQKRRDIIALINERMAALREGSG